MISLLIWTLIIPLLAVLSSLFIKTSQEENFKHNINFQYLGLWVGLVEFGYTIYLLIFVHYFSFLPSVFIKSNVKLWNGVLLVFVLDHISLFFMVLGSFIFLIWFIGCFYMPKTRIKEYVLSLLVFESLYMAIILTDDTMVLSAVFLILISILIFLLALWSLRSNLSKVMIIWSFVLCFCLLLVFSMNYALFHTYRFQDYHYVIDKTLFHLQLTLGEYLLFLIPSLFFIFTILPFWPFHYWYKYIIKIIGYRYAVLYSSLFILIGFYITFRWLIPLVLQPHSVVNQSYRDGTLFPIIQYGIQLYALFSVIMFLITAWKKRSEYFKFILYIFFSQLSFLSIFLIGQNNNLMFGAILVILNHIIVFNILLLTFMMLRLKRFDSIFVLKLDSWRIQSVIFLILLLLTGVPLSLGFEGYFFIISNLYTMHMIFYIGIIIIFLFIFFLFMQMFYNNLFVQKLDFSTVEKKDLTILEFFIILLLYIPLFSWAWIPENWIVSMYIDMSNIFQG